MHPRGFVINILADCLFRRVFGASALVVCAPHYGTPRRAFCERASRGLFTRPVRAREHSRHYQAAWPALRALALDCGVHPLALDGRTVTIGVEAL